MKVALFILSSVACYAPCAFSEVFPHNWDGFHAGLIFGGQWGRSSDTTGAFGYNADDDQWTFNESGYNVGAELGYNYLWHQIVLGPEVEWGYLGMFGRGAQPFSPGFDTVGTTNSDLYTALRGRIGMDLNNYLLFATGGALGVNYNQRVIDSCDIAPCGGSTIEAQKNSFVWGYTVGGGVEHYINSAWSAKIEGLYFDMSSQRFSGTTNLGDTYDWTGKTLGYIVRGGLNYHF